MTRSAVQPKRFSDRYDRDVRPERNDSCQEMLELEVERVELVWCVSDHSLYMSRRSIIPHAGKGPLTISYDVVSYHPMHARSTHRLTWWSSFCGRPDTTTAPMGVRSHPLIQIGMAGTSVRRECNVRGHGAERAGVRCKVQGVVGNRRPRNAKCERRG
jgi:hypothetical protein